MIKQLKNYFYERFTDSTISPPNFLPMIVTTRDKATQLMEGKLEMPPMISREQVEALEAEIRRKYPVLPEKESITKGYLINTADLYTLGFSMIPLVFDQGRFVKSDRKLLKEGDTAVIFLQPQLFFHQLQVQVQRIFPNLRYLELAAAEYPRNASQQVEDWNLFAKPRKDHWKREFLVMARLNHNLAVSNSNPVNAQSFVLENMASMAVLVPVHELVQGHFPEIFRDQQLLDYMDTFQFQKNGIQNHIFRVAANVMEITPTALWIERFQTILAPEQWIVNTITEKLIADGASMPRLIFHHVNGVEKIVIGINRLEFRFQFWTEKEHSIVESCLKLIDENIQTRYCHMDVETNANLGTIREYQALKTEHFLQSRTFCHDGIFSKELLEMDYCVHPNILGINGAQKAWHYCIHTFTPENEHFMWYSSSDVMDFFDQKTSAHQKRIAYLLKGHAYARYQKISKYH